MILVVVPAYNEEEGIAQLYRRVTAAAAGWREEYELLVIEAALAAVWPGLPHQRCLVHKLRNLVACVPRPLRAAVVRVFRRSPAR